MEPGQAQQNLSTTKPLLDHLSSLYISVLRRYHALLHLTRPLKDFANLKSLSVYPPRNGGGAVDINILVNRYKTNITLYKYNYILSSFVPLGMVTLFYWSVLLSVMTSVVVSVGLMNVTKINHPVVTKVISLLYSTSDQYGVSNKLPAITPLHKSITVTVLSVLIFWAFGGLSTITVTLITCVFLSSIHALLRSKPPALTQPSDNVPLVPLSTQVVNNEEEEIIEDEIKGNVRQRGSAVKAAAPGVIRKKAE
jgi:hypothetical protein